MTETEVYNEFMKTYKEATDLVAEAINEKIVSGKYKIPPEIVSMAMVQVGVGAMEEIMGAEKTILALNDLIQFIQKGDSQ